MTAGSVDVDVIIAGGGMTGTAAALALAPLDLRIAVVEAAARGAPVQPSFDERSTALSRSSQRLFAALGVWDEIRSSSAPIRQVHVSDKGRFGFAHIDAAEQGVEALGYVVINRVLGGVLDAALAANDNVTAYCPARLAALGRSGDCILATARRDDGTEVELSAALLVAADGTGSSVRELLGIGVLQESYGQRAVIGNLRTERAIGDVAYERFTAHGPLALLPMTGGRAAFVWTLGDRDTDRVLSLGDDAFLAELQDAFGTRLGAFEKAGARADYPLSLSKAVRLTAERAVLVGNAAHGLHPVAAQGFNLGLRDVAALADCIADALATADADIGAASVLERYASWRKNDQRKLVAFTDGLVRVFRHPRRSVRMLRDVGMLAFDLLPGARREFARHTMGLSGRLPRLSRGVPLR